MKRRALTHSSQPSRISLGTLLSISFFATTAPIRAFLFRGDAVITPKQQRRHAVQRTAPFLMPAPMSQEEETSATSLKMSTMSVDEAISSRYACTRFQPTNSSFILQQAYQALDIARRAPSGFNMQPYKLLVVHDQDKKEAMSKFCCGHNAHRVRESVCTVVFLADRQVLQNWQSYLALSSSPSASIPARLRKQIANLKALSLIGLFSSGFPYLPYILAGPLSFLLGLVLRILSWISRTKVVVPTVTGSLTWSAKNTMLVAMAYMLACTSRGIATCPMEGYNVWGIRQALNIPRRYSIPLIVATGVPFSTSMQGQDDVGMSHGPPSTKSSTRRFPSDDVIYGNEFGNGASNLFATEKENCTKREED